MYTQNATGKYIKVIIFMFVNGFGEKLIVTVL